MYGVCLYFHVHLVVWFEVLLWVIPSLADYVMLNGNRNLYSYRFNVNKLHMPLTIIINGWNYFQAKVAMISLCPNSCGLTYDLCDSFCFVKVRLLFRTIQASCVDSHVTNVTPKHSLKIVYNMDDSLYITHRNNTTFVKIQKDLSQSLVTITTYV